MELTERWSARGVKVRNLRNALFKKVKIEMQDRDCEGNRTGETGNKWTRSCDVRREEKC